MNTVKRGTIDGDNTRVNGRPIFALVPFHHTYDETVCFQGEKTMSRHSKTHLPTHLPRLLLTLVFALAMFVVASFVGTPGASAATATAPAPNPQTAKFEINFMKTLIDHHYSGVIIDQICVKRATHDPLRDLCAKEVKDQQMQINMMQSWLKKWYGIDYEPRLDAQGKAIVQYVSSLGGGRTFEIGFMENLIPHHLSAIIMSESCVKRAYHDALKDMCENVISSQTMSIRMLNDWLCDWYSLCNKEY